MLELLRNTAESHSRSTDSVQSGRTEDVRGDFTDQECVSCTMMEISDKFDIDMP